MSIATAAVTAVIAALACSGRGRCAESHSAALRNAGGHVCRARVVQDAVTGGLVLVYSVSDRPIGYVADDAGTWPGSSGRLARIIKKSTKPRPISSNTGSAGNPL